MQCVELASHGYVVFAVNSMAGDSTYVERKNGTPVLYNYQREFKVPSYTEKDWAVRRE